MKSYRSNTPASPSKGYTLPGIPHKRRGSNTPPRNYPSQQLKDYGPYPFAAQIENATEANTTFRTALWTGDYLQLTLMSIAPGEDIGLEIHPNTDQFIRIESGSGMVMMGDDPDTPNFQQIVGPDYAFIIPAGKWHNLINIGPTPIKLYSLYAPPQHPFGTVHETKEDAEQAEAAEKKRLKITSQTKTAQA